VGAPSVPAFVKLPSILGDLDETLFQAGLLADR
jgi:hypothetical protein